VIWSRDYIAAHEHLPQRLRKTTELLERAAPTLEKFDRLAQRPFLVFPDPPSLDERIVNQFALFSLFSGPDLRLEDWIASRPDVRDQLDQANITERVLFPGLDRLSRWLARPYTPRRPDALRGTLSPALRTIFE
jgi:hypothetical protein